MRSLRFVPLPVGCQLNRTGYSAPVDSWESFTAEAIWHSIAKPARIKEHKHTNIHTNTQTVAQKRRCVKTVTWKVTIIYLGSISDGTTNYIYEYQNNFLQLLFIRCIFYIHISILGPAHTCLDSFVDFRLIVCCTGASRSRKLRFWCENV